MRADPEIPEVRSVLSQLIPALIALLAVAYNAREQLNNGNKKVGEGNGDYLAVVNGAAIGTLARSLLEGLDNKTKLKILLASTIALSASAASTYVLSEKAEYEDPSAAAIAAFFFSAGSFWLEGQTNAYSLLSKHLGDLTFATMKGVSSLVGSLYNKVYGEENTIDLNPSEILEMADEIQGKLASLEMADEIQGQLASEKTEETRKKEETSGTINPRGKTPSKPLQDLSSDKTK